MNNFFLIILTLLIFDTCAEVSPRQEEKSCLVIGHRGAPEYSGENTLFGFKKALELGADGFELDLILTQDKNLAVLHDFELTRLVGAQQLETLFSNKAVNAENKMIFPTVNFSMKELQQLKVTYPSPGENRLFYQELGEDFTIPSFEEVLNFYVNKINNSKFSSAIIYLEIKTDDHYTSSKDYQIILDRLYAGIQKYQLQDKGQQVWLQSFDYDLMTLMGKDHRFDGFSKTQLGFGKKDLEKTLNSKEEMKTFLQEVIIKRNLQNFHLSKVRFMYFLLEKRIDISALCNELGIACHLYTFRDHRFQKDYENLKLSEEKKFENPEAEIKFFMDLGIKAIMSDNILSALSVTP